jgi:hypothetical protein
VVYKLTNSTPWSTIDVTNYKEHFELNDQVQWLGNNRLNFLTSFSATYDLRIDMWNENSFHQHTEFRNFTLGSIYSKYKFEHAGFIDGFAGDGGMGSGMTFRTKDDCPSFDAGWWFPSANSTCGGSVLTGDQRKWKMRLNIQFDVKEVIMRVKPNHIKLRK